jgi:hypothetical protein
MKRCIHCFVIIGLAVMLLPQVSTVKAQEIGFSYAALPDSLVRNTPVVKLEESITFSVSDFDEAEEAVHQVFLVTSAAGEALLTFNQYSNKFIILQDAEIKVYDGARKQTARYKKRDMFTTAVGEGLVEDGNVTFFKVTAPVYPMYLEYNYTLKYKGTLFYPSYNIQHAGESVLQSSFTAKVPSSVGLRYTSKNIAVNPQVTQQDKYDIYHWQTNHLKAFRFEEGAVNYATLYPKVILAPNKFKIYDTEGDLTTWQNFGKWEYGLIQQLDNVPEETRMFFAELTKTATSDREKIKRVYQYLQQDFRYVSIQLGIGGFKPLPASFTHKNKFGDCKGLSYYTYAVLKSLGIKSHVALINAGHNALPVDPAFPSNQFNHMILFVPLAKDSIWLECTSKTNDFGVLGTFTENRNALVITENGGLLLPTPQSKATDNTLDAFTTIAVEPSGSGIAQVSFNTTGEVKDVFLNNFLNEQSDEQKEFLLKYLKFRHPDNVETIHKTAGLINKVQLKLSYTKLQEFAAGSKLFLPGSLHKSFVIDLPNTDLRRTDYFFNYPFLKRDTTVYMLPQNFEKDILPEAKKITSRFAQFEGNFWYNEKEHAIYCATALQLNQHRIPAQYFIEMKAFFEDVKKYCSSHIIVKKS